MAWVRKQTWMLWIFSGALMGIGAAVPTFWMVAVLGAVIYIYKLQISQSLRSALIGSWVAWSVKSLFAVWWIISVYPLDWLPVDLENVQLSIVILCWIVSGVSLGMGGLCIGGAWYWIKDRVTAGVLLMPVFAGLWMFSEVIGSFMYSAVSYGPGGGFNVSLSFGYMGYTVANHPLLLQLAAIAGVYGLSVVFAAASWVVASLLKKDSLRLYVLGGLCVVYATSFVVIAMPSVQGDQYTIGLIETDFEVSFARTPAGRLQNEQAVVDAVGVALSQNPDYLLLPEGGGLFDQYAPVNSTKTIFALKFADPQTVIIDSGNALAENGEVTQAFIYDGVDRSVTKVQKRYLVPQGEYISYGFIWIARLLGYGHDVSEIAHNLQYVIGPLTSQSHMQSHHPGILFCLESVEPTAVQTILTERDTVPFIAHPISHAWFNDPYTLWSQQDLMLQVQAVWGDVYIVAAANQATSKVYASNGAVMVPAVVQQGENWLVRLATVPR